MSFISLLALAAVVLANTVLDEERCVHPIECLRGEVGSSALCVERSCVYIKVETLCQNDRDCRSPTQRDSACVDGVCATRPAVRGGPWCKWCASTAEYLFSPKN